MTYALAVDPGNVAQSGRCAVAAFQSAQLVAIGWSDSRDWGRPDLVIVEKPMVYPKGRARPNDLLDLAWAGALFVGSLRPGRIETLRPRTWKGQLAKCVCHNNIWPALTWREQALFPSDTGERIRAACERYAKTRKETNYSSVTHNLLDAAGIGCYWFKRALR